jgi:hypothetical protein
MDSSSDTNSLLTGAAATCLTNSQRAHDDSNASVNLTDLTMTNASSQEPDLDSQASSYTNPRVMVESFCLQSSDTMDSDDSGSPLSALSFAPNEHYVADAGATAHISVYDGDSLQDFVSDLVSAKDLDDSLYTTSPPRDSSPFPSSSPPHGFGTDMDVGDSDVEGIQRPEFRSSSPMRSSTPDLAFSSSPVRRSSSAAVRVTQSSPPVIFAFCILVD